MVRVRVFLKSVPILMSLLLIFMLRMNIDDESKLLFNFLVYFPVMFEVFKFGFQMLFWKSGFARQENKNVTLVSTIFSAIFFIAGLISTISLLEIVGLSLVAAEVSKKADFFRQKNVTRAVLVFDSAIVMIAYMCFYRYVPNILSVLYVSLLFTLLCLNWDSDNRGESSFTMKKVYTRLNFTLILNYGMIMQACFFALFTDILSIGYLYVWRLLVGVGSLSTYFLKYFPAESLTGRNSYIGNCVSGFGCLSGALLIYYDDQDLFYNYIWLVMFMVIYQFFRYSTSRNVYLLSRCTYSVIAARVAYGMIIMLVGYLLFIILGYSDIVLSILPVMYLFIAFYDYRATKAY